MTHPEDRLTGDGEKHLQTLESTGLFRTEEIQALRDHWIETIEQFLSATATAEGSEGMIRLLDVSEGAFHDIRMHLLRLAPPELQDEMTLPQPGGSLGVILTDEQKEQRGCSEKGGDA